MASFRLTLLNKQYCVTSSLYQAVTIMGICVYRVGKCRKIDLEGSKTDLSSRRFFTEHVDTTVLLKCRRNVSECLFIVFYIRHKPKVFSRADEMESLLRF